MSITNIDDYLRNHTAIKGETFTHTRIGDKDQNIFGGSYNIPSNEWSDFMKKYYQHVFINGKKEYLTEKQLIENGPLLIDMDFRYDTSITSRQHTEDHVLDGIMIYAEKIRELVTIPEKASINVFVMEKKDVNCMDDKTKDGIHIIFGIKMHKGLQVLVRNKVMPDLKEMWEDLPITNSWDDILDEGVTKGFVNWQVYGSRKPGHQAYIIKYHYVLEYEGDWSVTKQNITTFSTEKNMEKLSARYTGYPEFEMKESVKEQFERAKETLSRQKSGDKAAANTSARNKYKLKIVGGNTNINYYDINSEELLDSIIEEVFEEAGSTNYRIKESHQYTMSLPVSYYGPGSYNKWIRVGWALANTSPKLFLSWLKFSCQENCRDSLKGGNGKFDWRNVKDLYEIWCGFNSNNEDSLTHRSIMYWSKSDAREKYNKIRKETIDYFIEQSITTATEHDLAVVLYNMFKDDFICVSIKNNVWYEYINHRWFEIDSGNTLRLFISKNMYDVYFAKSQEVLIKMETLGGDQSTKEFDIIKKRQIKLLEICTSLKRTTWKNNIMREARELFYDKDFIEKLDQNPYLLCFNNYVIDFKTQTHRKGQPDDYISKCTNIDYIPLAVVNNKHSHTVAELEQFFEQLFPDVNLRNYMWEHLASCLIGTIINQTFSIYKGSGRNGKSKLVELMGRGLGSYKGTVPITLITQKRNTIGSTSSEVAQLMGVRYAVMQEMSKGDKMNEGIMKEITGGDPIQARALFKDTVTFIPQFKLVVCTNTDFEETSNDDGTWRRMRYIDFVAKMLDKPYEDPKFPKSEFPYQFPLDKNLDKKFDMWAPVLMTLLVEKAYKLQGVVNDCDVVLSNSDKHREKQDFMAEFTRDKIKTQSGGRIKKSELLETFKQWYNSNYGKNTPKGKEVFEFMDRRFGEYKNGWHNAVIIYDEDEENLIATF
jgi:P4 family phage/plasmid primase-like protien